MKTNIKKFNGLIYAVILASVVGLIMIESWIFHISDPTWAIVSGVVCSELEIEQARTLVYGRIAATLVGVALSFLMLVIIGHGYFTIIAGVILTTLICQYIIHLGTHWKFATATGAIILVAGLNQQSVMAAEAIAYKRAIEVIMGSVTAGFVSLILGQSWENFKRVKRV